MKTLQELYNEIIASEKMKTAFAEAAKGGKALDFLKAQGCDVTEEELTVFLKSKTGELSDEELDNVAGGKCSQKSVDILVSIRGLGVACALIATVSAIAGKTGSSSKDQSALCHE